MATFENRQLLRNALSSSAFWIINKALVRYIGGHSETVLLSELVYQEERAEIREELDPENFFTCSQQELEEFTAITIKSQKRYCDKLEKLGFLHTEFRGIPRKKYYQLQHDVIIECLKTLKPQGRNNNGQKVDYRVDNKSTKQQTNSLTSIRQKVSSNNKNKKNKKKENTPPPSQNSDYASWVPAE